MQRAKLIGIKPLIGVAALVVAAVLVAASFGGRVSAQGGGGGGSIDLTGEWSGVVHEDQPERGPGPELGDYSGMPINDAARLHADSWDASRLTLPEEQCMPHPSTYAIRGPMNIRVWKDVDPITQEVIAIRTHGSWMAPERAFYMDGRARPPAYAAHTWQGFSTGRYEAGTLMVTTTHLKQGWLRRNGVHHSDRVTMTERFIRHGEHLLIVTTLTDPVYLTEPYLKTTNLRWAPQQNVGAYPCGGFETIVEVNRPAGIVPSHLPGKNEFLKEFATTFNIPFEATRGGAETTLPEYQAKLQELAAKK